MNFALPGLLDSAPVESDRLPRIMPLMPTPYGEKWEGIVTIGPVTFFGNTPAYAATDTSLVFFDDSMVVAHTLSSADGGVSITDAAEWLFSVPPVQLPDTMTPGLWRWQFKVTDAQAETTIIYEGVIRIQHAPETEV